MNKLYVVLVLVWMCCGLSCKKSSTQIQLKTPVRTSYTNHSLNLEEPELYDKILGALVGSAIGDAMGASTEMWYRKEIQNKYGYITGLTMAERVQSPEGTWDHNLNAGATTDDTRWKYIMVPYLLKNKNELNEDTFADFISDYYQSEVSQLREASVLNSTDSLDEKMQKIDWIKEWARVTLAYQKGPMEYQKAQNRFYGGEMSCAGMLYTPMFGLIASTPEEAYTIAYDHTLFDIGYAKDISSLVAAITQMAMRTKNMDSILNASVYIDPFHYQDSRLVGRLSYQIANSARRAVDQSNNIYTKDTTALRIPKNYSGNSQEWERQAFVYTYLEKNARAIPFHSGEIWEILIAGLAFGNGDFEKTMQFIINYGRDNDTVAAVAGMILGVKDGYSGLPEDLANEIIRINKDQIGIDLEDMASRLVSHLTTTTSKNSTNGE